MGQDPGAEALPSISSAPCCLTHCVMATTLVVLFSQSLFPVSGNMPVASLKRNVLPTCPHVSDGNILPTCPQDQWERVLTPCPWDSDGIVPPPVLMSVMGTCPHHMSLGLGWDRAPTCPHVYDGNVPPPVLMSLDGTCPHLSSCLCGFYPTSNSGPSPWSTLSGARPPAHSLPSLCFCFRRLPPSLCLLRTVCLPVGCLPP